MINKVIIKNYKSLVDFEANLSTATNMAIIYGENGSGKTNFIDALSAIANQVHSLFNINFAMKKLKDVSTKTSDIESLNFILRSFKKDTSLEGLFFDHITIGEEKGSIEINMIIEGYNAKYKLIYNKHQLIEEELTYLINKNVSKMYNIKIDDNELNETFISPQLFSSSVVEKEFLNQLNQYWGEHSFLSVLFYFINSRNQSFWDSKINTNLITVLGYFTNFYSKNLPEENARLQKVAGIEGLGLNDLGFGELKNENKSFETLIKAQEILYDYLSPLYRDIVDIKYEVDVDKENDLIQYELFLSKKISGKIRNISYHQESSGTKNVIKLLPYLISYLKGSIILIDEIENAIHDLLIEGILTSLIDEENKNHGQIIATTHNTLIMEKLDDDSIFILNESNGKKTIDSLQSYSNTRSRDNHNLRKRYLSGLYQGIPYTRDIDFLEIQEALEDE